MEKKMEDCKSSSDAHVPYRKRKYMLSASGSSPETVVDKDPAVIITSSSADDDKESHKKTASHPSKKIKCSNDPADDGDSRSDVSFSGWVDGSRAATDENAPMGRARNEELKESDDNHESQAEDDDDDEVFSFHKQSNDDGLDKGHEQLELDLLLANKFGGNGNAVGGEKDNVNNGKEKTNHGGKISRRARGNDGATVTERTTQQQHPSGFRLFGHHVRF